MGRLSICSADLHLPLQTAANKRAPRSKKKTKKEKKNYTISADTRGREEEKWDLGARFKSVGEGGETRQKKKRDKTNEQKAKTASKHRRQSWENGRAAGEGLLL